jgi:GTPase SAR1 family protein
MVKIMIVGKRASGKSTILRNLLLSEVSRNIFRMSDIRMIGYCVDATPITHSWREDIVHHLRDNGPAQVVVDECFTLNLSDIKKLISLSENFSVNLYLCSQYWRDALIDDVDIIIYHHDERNYLTRNHPQFTFDENKEWMKYDRETSMCVPFDHDYKSPQPTIHLNCPDTILCDRYFDLKPMLLSYLLVDLVDIVLGFIHPPKHECC